jgi:hypothetical protein
MSVSDSGEMAVSCHCQKKAYVLSPIVMTPPF